MRRSEILCTGIADETNKERRILVRAPNRNTEGPRSSSHECFFVTDLPSCPPLATASELIMRFFDTSNLTVHTRPDHSIVNVRPMLRIETERDLLLQKVDPHFRAGGSRSPSISRWDIKSNCDRADVLPVQSELYLASPDLCSSGLVCAPLRSSPLLPSPRPLPLIQTLPTWPRLRTRQLSAP